MARTLPESDTIDLLKVFASQAIVAHHLASYGPISEAIERSLPSLSAWLIEFAGMAVQVFLVIAGFLASAAISARPAIVGHFPWREIALRYLRLTPPYAAALLLAIAAAALARDWFDEAFVPPTVSLHAIGAHLSLTHGIFESEAFSTGVWYVAIDLQLYALLLLSAWLTNRLQGKRSSKGGHVPVRSSGVREGPNDPVPSQQPLPIATPALIAALGAVSLLVFNRNTALDNWAIYFFGSYSMGSIVYWSQSMRRPSAWIAAMTITALLALMIEFRERPAVALCTALLLFAAGRFGWSINAASALRKAVRLFAAISYALFLIHFPVMLLVSTLFAAAGADTNSQWLLAAALTWALSLPAAYLLHRQVELRFIKPSRRAAIS